MERWKVCPECGSANIHCDFEVTPRVADQRYANTLIYGKTFLRLKVTPVDVFVCVDCGNIRSFVSSDEVLRHIQEAWPRADSVMPAGDEEVRRLVERIEGGSEGEEDE
jgi:hypothetical protein